VLLGLPALVLGAVLLYQNRIGLAPALMLSACLLLYLVLVAAALGSKAVSATGTAPGLGPYLVGCLVWAIGLSLGGTTGYAINPARDLGPRLAHALLPIAGKGGSNWSYAPVPILGPLAGAALAGWLVRAVGF
jgi:glycerol uptake facilitator protein